MERNQSCPNICAQQVGALRYDGECMGVMRGGKHKAQIIQGGSYVDSLDGSINHAATLGAQATATCR